MLPSLILLQVFGWMSRSLSEPQWTQRVALIFALCFQYTAPHLHFRNTYRKSPHVQSFRFSRMCSINLIIVLDIRSKNRRYESSDGRCVWCRILYTTFKFRKLVEVHRKSWSLILVWANNDVHRSEMTLKDVMNSILCGNPMKASPSLLAFVSASYWYFDNALGPSHPYR